MLSVVNILVTLALFELGDALRIKEPTLPSTPLFPFDSFVRQTRNELNPVLAHETSSIIAVELTGCLGTLTMTEPQESYKQQVHKLKSLGLQVDVFGVFQACSPHEHDITAESVSMALKNIFAGSNVYIDLMKSNFSVIDDDGVLLPEYVNQIVHYKNIFENKAGETNVGHTLNYFLKWKRIKELRHSAHIKYAAVWASRPDIVTGDIPWADILKVISKDNSAWVTVPSAFYRNAITDQISFLSSSAADHHDSIFDNVDFLTYHQQIMFHPETLVQAHMKSGDLSCHMLRQAIHNICREGGWQSSKKKKIGCTSKGNGAMIPQSGLNWCPFLERSSQFLIIDESMFEVDKENEDQIFFWVRNSEMMGRKPVLNTLPIASPVPFGVWVTNGIGALIIFVGLAYILFANTNNDLLGMCSVLCYISFSCLIDINISIAGNGHGVKFEPACSVLIQELGKLIVSIVLYTVVRWNKICTGHPFFEENFRMKDAMYLSVPGCLFAVNNILIYVSIGRNEIASFGVFRDTVIFFNAAIWGFVFQSELGKMRYFALAIIFVGLCINQMTPFLNGLLSLSILIVVLMGFTNACASVANEYAIKMNSSLDLNLQNSVLYCFCSVFAFGYVATLHPAKLSSVSAFFAHIDATAWIIIGLQMAVGLLVSRILKYADTMTKTVGACLRGPIVIVLAPFIGLHSRLDWLTMVSAVVVAGGACLFLGQGRPTPGVGFQKQH